MSSTKVYMVTGLARAEHTGSSDDWLEQEVAATEAACYRSAYVMINDYIDGDFTNIHCSEEEIKKFLELKNNKKHKDAIDFWNTLTSMEVTIMPMFLSVQEDCSDIEFHDPYSEEYDNDDSEDAE